MMLLWAVLYFCVMLGYNNGEYRFYHSAVTVFAMILYYVSLHKINERVFHYIGGKVNMTVIKFAKKLKISKKSFKKLLHFTN